MLSYPFKYRLLQLLSSFQLLRLKVVIPAQIQASTTSMSSHTIFVPKVVIPAQIQDSTTYMGDKKFCTVGVVIPVQIQASPTGWSCKKKREIWLSYLLKYRLLQQSNNPRVVRLVICCHTRSNTGFYNIIVGREKPLEALSYLLKYRLLQQLNVLSHWTVISCHTCSNTGF